MDNQETIARRVREQNKIYIARMALRQAVWQVPHEPGRGVLKAPVDAITGHEFRGANALKLLEIQRSFELEDPRWIIETDVEKNGFRLKPGAKPRDVFVKDSSGLWVGGHAFHVSEVFDFPLYVEKGVAAARPYEFLDEVIARAGLKHAEDTPGTYYIDPATHTLHSPADVSGVADPREHYGKLFYHMLRAENAGLQRAQELTGDAGAIDSLTAHIAHLIVSSRLHVPFYPDNSVDYSDQWIRLIEVDQDKDVVKTVARDAELVATQFVGRVFDVAHNHQQDRQAEKTTFREAMRQLDAAATREDVLALEERIQAGFVADIPTVQFAQADWPRWTEAIQAKTRSFEVPLARTAPRGATPGGRRQRRIPEEQRRYIFVPFEERFAAYEAGSTYDREKKLHYIPVGADVTPFQKWLEPPRGLTPQQVIDAFIEECKGFGLEMSAAVVQMDGKWRGTTVTTSENTKKTAGRYVLGDDGRGYIRNLDTGEEAPWRPSEPLSNDDKTREQLEEFRRNSERVRAVEERRQQQAEAKLTAKWASLPDATQHPYTDRKQVPAIGLKLWGEDLAIPMMDPDGVVRNIQRIPPTPGGQKLYPKDARKSGRSYVIGSLKDAPVVFFAEGYASAMTPHIATKFPSVVCFDSGNLASAMKGLRDQIPPDADKIIIADNDLVTSERLASTLNSTTMRKKIGYPEIQVNDVDFALNGGTTYFLELGESQFSLRVTETNDVEHYEMRRLYGEIWRGSERVHRVMINNVGMEKALAAAEAEGAKVFAPSFSDPDAYRKGFKDINDLQTTEGLPVVQDQLASVVDLVKGRQFAQERARELKYNVIEVRPLENDSRHVGQVVLHAGCHAVQDVGRSTAVAHSYRDLDRIPQQGAVARIEYRGGRGVVADAAEQNKGKGIGR